MTKTRNTKSALISAILVLCLCFSALAGTTFAWFTDSVTSSGNIIQTGNLDVQLLMYDGTEYVDISESEKPIFGEDSLIADWEDVDLLWEPGKTQIVYLGVKNAGSLALKYNVVVDVEDNGLVGALDYAIVDGATKDAQDALGVASWTDILAIEGVQTGPIKAGRTIAAENGALESDTYDYFALAVHMNEDAGNEYQDKNIVIDITIMATQLSSENDSFGNDYDADAPLDVTEGMSVKVGDQYFADFASAIAAAEDGAVIEMMEGTNTSANPLSETIVIDKEVTLIPNGMYLVSAAPATFTVTETGKLTIEEGSYTVKNTATNGAAVLVDGGEFEMAGGSFDAHTAVKTTEGKSSTVTLSAGWSNRVTVGFDLKGNDTLNVTGGSLYTGKEAVKTAANTHVDINISGGTLSGNTTQYSAVVDLNGTATVDITGGTIESRYSSGYNGSPAIQATAVPTEINISGDAKVTSKGYAVVLGDNMRNPEDLGDRFTLNVSGNASISATSAMGFGIRFAQDCCDVTVSGNATVNATYQAIQMNHNSNVFLNSTLTIAENATIKSQAGSIGGGYAIAANGNVTITGGTITGSTAGLAIGGEGANVVIDNSGSEMPITINKVEINHGVTLTINGNPTLPNGFVYVDDQATFEAAINDASSTTIYLADGTYKMPSSNVSKTVKISGSKDAVLDLTLGAYMENATVTFSGITIKTSTGMANGNGSDYAAFYSNNVKYSYCTFVGPMRVGRDGANFEYCTFTELGNDYVWTYGNDVTFKYCTFNTDGKAILIYSDGGDEVAKVTVMNCTFNSTQGAKAGAIANQNCAAIEIDNYGNGVYLAAQGNTYDDNFSGEWRIKSYYSNSDAVSVGKYTNDRDRVWYTDIALDGKYMTIDADKNVTVNE